MRMDLGGAFCRGGTMTALVVLVAWIVGGFISPGAAFAAATPSSAAVPASPFANGRHALIDGVQLHVREWPAARTTEATAPRCAVLLVHALAGSTYSFRHLAPSLADAGHRVLAVDLPGYGYSERRPFDGSAAAALWTLLDAEGAEGRWCLAGHSMGARVVGQMVAAAPSRPAAVAYLSGSPVRARRRNPSMFRAQPIRGIVLAMAERRYLDARGLADALEEGLGRVPEAEVVDAYLAPLRLPGTLPAILDGYARDMGDDRTLPKMLAQPPSLVLWGGRDEWLKPDVGEQLHAALPQSRFVLVADAAHSPMETHPEAVLPPLLALFDGVSKAAPRVIAATSPTPIVSAAASPRSGQ